MKALALALLLTVHGAEPDLINERLAIERTRTDDALFTVIATWADGAPVNKGWISCDGPWFKHSDEEDEQITEPGLWFKTDARGAIVLNPPTSWTWRSDDNDNLMTCHARKDGMTGIATFALDDGSVHEIVINTRARSEEHE